MDSGTNRYLRLCLGALPLAPSPTGHAEALTLTGSDEVLHLIAIIDGVPAVNPHPDVLHITVLDGLRHQGGAAVFFDGFLHAINEGAVLAHGFGKGHGSRLLVGFV